MESNDEMGAGEEEMEEASNEPLAVERLLSGALDLVHPLHGLQGVSDEVPIVLHGPVAALLELESRILCAPPNQGGEDDV